MKNIHYPTALAKIKARLLNDGLCREDLHKLLNDLFECAHLRFKSSHDHCEIFERIVNCLTQERLQQEDLLRLVTDAERLEAQGQQRLAGLD